jgi:hypothetical protein
MPFEKKSLPIDKGDVFSSSNHNFVKNCSNLFLIDLAPCHFFFSPFAKTTVPLERISQIISYLTEASNLAIGLSEGLQRNPTANLVPKPEIYTRF